MRSVIIGFLVASLFLGYMVLWDNPIMPAVYERSQFAFDTLGDFRWEFWAWYDNLTQKPDPYAGYEGE